MLSKCYRNKYLLTHCYTLKTSSISEWHIKAISDIKNILILYKDNNNIIDISHIIESIINLESIVHKNALITSPYLNDILLKINKNDIMLTDNDDAIICLKALTYITPDNDINEDYIELLKKVYNAINPYKSRDKSIDIINNEIYNIIHTLSIRQNKYIIKYLNNDNNILIQKLLSRLLDNNNDVVNINNIINLRRDIWKLRCNKDIINNIDNVIINSISNSNNKLDNNTLISIMEYSIETGYDIKRLPCINNIMAILYNHNIDISYYCRLYTSILLHCTNSIDTLIEEILKLSKNNIINNKKELTLSNIITLIDALNDINKRIIGDINKDGIGVNKKILPYIYNILDNIQDNILSNINILPSLQLESVLNIYLPLIINYRKMINNNNDYIISVYNNITPINELMPTLLHIIRIRGSLRCKDVFGNNSFNPVKILTNIITTPRILNTPLSEKMDLLASVIESIPHNDYIINELSSMIFNDNNITLKEYDNVLNILSAILSNNVAISCNNNINNKILSNTIRIVIPMIEYCNTEALVSLLTLLSDNKTLLPQALPTTGSSSSRSSRREDDNIRLYSPLNIIGNTIIKYLNRSIHNINDLTTLTNILKALSNLNWYDTICVSLLMKQYNNISLTLQSTTSNDIIHLVRSFRKLRIHDATLLRRLTMWYISYINKELYINNNNIPIEYCKHIAAFAAPLTDLGYYSIELIQLVEAALPTTKGKDDDDDECYYPSRLIVDLLNILSRQRHFSSKFENAINILINNNDSNNDNNNMTTNDWIKAFQIHLCATIEGPPFIRNYITQNDNVKTFFADNTSFIWYTLQERERTNYLHSDICIEINDTIKELGWPLCIGNELNEVYHIEMITPTTTSEQQEGEKEREDQNTYNKGLWHNNSLIDNKLNDVIGGKRTAIVCIKEEDELRWYNPIRYKDDIDDIEYSESKRIMIGNSLTKIRHLNSLGWKVIPLWVSEWYKLNNMNDRCKYLIERAQEAYAVGPATTTTFDVTLDN